jgi:excisionase family DNA binding protein
MTNVADRPFTVGMAAAFLGCSHAHVKNLCARGQLRHFRIGRLIRIPAAALDGFAAQIPGGRYAPKPKRQRRIKPLSRINEIRKSLPKTARDESGFVYFIQAESGGLIKIGTALDPLVRLVNLQSGSPLRLVVLGCLRGGRTLERALHREFANHHRHFEWFEANAAIVEFIAEALAAEGIPRAEYEKPVLYRSASVRRLAERSDG